MSFVAPRPRSLLRSARSSSVRLQVEPRAHLFARSKERNTLGWHVYGLPGSRVAPNACAAGACGEGTKATEFDTPPLSERADDPIQNRCYNKFSLALIQIRVQNAHMHGQL